MEGRTWDDEMASRTEALKCRVCGGTNPYVCRCARQAWEAGQERHKKMRALPKLTLDDEWNNHCALVCSPSFKPCPTCKPKQSESFCACAKKEWIEWKKANPNF